MNSVPPGWYPDPEGRPSERYWDGNSWTSETRPYSFVADKPAPMTNKVGLDQNEKILLVFVGIAVLMLFLLFP